MKTYENIDSCPITGELDYFTYLNLGKMPLVNNLCDTKEDSLNCEKFDLKVNFHRKSKLSSLSLAIDPTILYSNYSYKSGVSQPYIEHCKDLYDWCKHYSSNWYKGNKNILDIGGNDGTLLKTFKEIDPTLEVLNIDMSSNLTQEAIKKGIPSINTKWGVECAKKFPDKFQTITTTNCFQHTKDINDFTAGVKIALTHNGHWFLEFPYWNNSLRTKQFDQVYHEHVYYYNIHSLYMLLAKHGLQILKINPQPIHGGTIRLVVGHIGDYSPSGEVAMKIRDDRGVVDLFSKEMDEQYYKNWADSIYTHLNECHSFINSLKSKGKTIAGFGAAAKGCVFLNASNIDHTMIDYVVDDTDLKQNKFIPGTGIPITSRKELTKNPPDYLIILAHNFSEYIIKSLPNFKGKFITFFPEIKIT